ncbi:hypothetical protein FH5T_03575 [Draconibacterium orientale]|uniref:Uncharacterized protein n=1 Tax=Draconibacterium orientale TaxID=1168034 RepID=A0ABM5QCX1_9BACT|nr:hypothetical protein FH5T_03575 [Draconibacterium orientale]
MIRIGQLVPNEKSLQNHLKMGIFKLCVHRSEKRSRLPEAFQLKLRHYSKTVSLFKGTCLP